MRCPAGLTVWGQLSTVGAHMLHWPWLVYWDGSKEWGGVESVRGGESSSSSTPAASPLPSFSSAAAEESFWGKKWWGTNVAPFLLMRCLTEARGQCERRHKCFKTPGGHKRVQHDVQKKIHTSFPRVRIQFSALLFTESQLRSVFKTFIYLVRFTLGFAALCICMPQTVPLPCSLRTLRNVSPSRETHNCEDSYTPPPASPSFLDKLRAALPPALRLAIYHQYPNLLEQHYYFGLG